MRSTGLVTPTGMVEPLTPKETTSEEVDTRETLATCTAQIGAN